MISGPMPSPCATVIGVADAIVFLFRRKNCDQGVENHIHESGLTQLGEANLRCYFKAISRHFFSPTHFEAFVVFPGIDSAMGFGHDSNLDSAAGLQKSRWSQRRTRASGLLLSPEAGPTTGAAWIQRWDRRDSFRSDATVGSSVSSKS